MSVSLGEALLCAGETCLLYFMVTKPTEWRKAVGFVKEIKDPTPRQKELQEKVNALAKGMRVSKNIQLVTSSWMIQAHGNTLIPWGEATINIPENYEKRYHEDSDMWLMKHEISHIKNNDMLKFPAVGIAATIFASIFFTSELVVATAVALAMIAYSHWMEGRADVSDLNLLTPKEIKRGIFFLNYERNMSRTDYELDQNDPDFQKLSIFHPKKLFSTIFYTSDGEFRDPLHPSLKNRTKNLAETCKRIHHVELDAEFGLLSRQQIRDIIQETGS